MQRTRWCGLGIPLAIALAAFFSCAGAAAEEQIHHIAFPSGLTHMVAPPDMQVPNQKVVSLILKPGETPDNWTEIAGVGILPTAAPMSDVMGWTPLSTTPGYLSCAGKRMNLTTLSPERVLYESRVRNCPPGPDYVQIGVIIRGKASLWHIFYGAKTEDLTPARREEVIRKFSAITYTP